MFNVKDLLGNYLTQASTYRGLLTFVSGLGVVHMSDATTNAVIGVCLAVAGLINVIIDERKAK